LRCDRLIWWEVAWFLNHDGLMVCDFVIFAIAIASSISRKDIDIGESEEGEIKNMDILPMQYFVQKRFLL
jgi:hypothetical protein